MHRIEHNSCGATAAITTPPLQAFFPTHTSTGAASRHTFRITTTGFKFIENAESSEIARYACMEGSRSIITRHTLPHAPG